MTGPRPVMGLAPFQILATPTTIGLSAVKLFFFTENNTPALSGNCRANATRVVRWPRLLIKTPFPNRNFKQRKQRPAPYKLAHKRKRGHLHSQPSKS